MTARRALAAVVALAALLAGCAQHDMPSPGVIAAYDPVLAFCARNLTSINDVCKQLTSASITTVYAHILLGHAGGRELEIHGRVTGGGDDHSWDEPPEQIPSDRSYRHSIQIERDQVCSGVPCTLHIEASVDGELVLTGSFTFT